MCNRRRPCHWLRMKDAFQPVPIFVNWFRRDAEGCLLWSDFREDARALRWIADRSRGRANAIEDTLGFSLPLGDLPSADRVIDDATFDDLIAIERTEFAGRARRTGGGFSRHGRRSVRVTPCQDAVIARAMYSDRRADVS